MGETEYWDEFAQQTGSGLVLGVLNVGYGLSNFADRSAHINCGISEDRMLDNIVTEFMLFTSSSLAITA